MTVHNNATDYILNQRRFDLIKQLKHSNKCPPAFSVNDNTVRIAPKVFKFLLSFPPLCQEDLLTWLR